MTEVELFFATFAPFTSLGTLTELLDRAHTLSASAFKQEALTL
jgi:hypothetical protein